MLDKHKHNINASIKKELSIGMRNRSQQEIDSNNLSIDHLKDDMDWIDDNSSNFNKD